jgi:hypothetical protein
MSDTTAAEKVEKKEAGAVEHINLKVVGSVNLKLLPSFWNCC